MIRSMFAAAALLAVAGAAQAAPQRVTYVLGTDNPEVRALADKGTLMLGPEPACDGAVTVRRDFDRGSTADPAIRYECVDVGRKAIVSLNAKEIRDYDPSRPKGRDPLGQRPLGGN
jgi:hypothetical protein